MHRDVACMFFYDAADIIQTQSKTLYGLCIALRHTKKFFEYVLNELRLYAHPVVTDLYHAVPVIFNKININVHRFIRILDGIVYYIMKGSFEVKAVAHYKNRSFTGQSETDMLAL